jgi:cobalt-zinc-cadmium efflux system outer membrane protein
MCGLLERATNFRNRRSPLNSKRAVFDFRRRYARWSAACASLAFVLLSPSTVSAQGQGPVKVALDEAIQLALQHNHNLLAARTTIQQSQAQEITANLRPNPDLFVDWDYLPAFSPRAATSAYLQSSTEADAGVSYVIERGGKRRARYQAAKDATTVTMSTVADNERTLTFQVASQFLAVELAESTLDLAQQDLKDYQNTVELTEIRYRSGAISQDDYLKIKIQLLQFQNDVAQALLAKVQGLADLRQMLGPESVPVNYDIAGQFEYQAVKANLEDLQMQAIRTRPDLRAAQQGITAANSQYLLAKADAKQDLTVQANYTHVNGINGLSFYTSIPLPIFNRNQGEIARTRYAITQSQELEKQADNQVATDVHDAYYNLGTNDEIVQLYLSGYLAEAQADRDIAEYSYQRGAASLLDFLDAERSYRSTQLAYRQVLAAYLTALEQLREAVGTRALP